VGKGYAPFRLIPFRLIPIPNHKPNPNPDPNANPNPGPNPNPNPCRMGIRQNGKTPWEVSSCFNVMSWVSDWVFCLLTVVTGKRPRDGSGTVSGISR